jgi:hypothetical protein
MPPRAFLRYIALPARPNGVLLIGVLTIGFELAVRARFVGIPLGAMMLFWLFAYSYVLLEHVAHGTREPPVLTIEMVNPTAAGRPLAQFGIVLLVWTGLHLLAQPLGPALLHVLEALLLLALPASIAALGIAEHWWQALLPGALWSLARALGGSYLLLLALALFYTAVLVGLNAVGLPTWLLCVAFTFAWLSLYAASRRCMRRSVPSSGATPSGSRRARASWMGSTARHAAATMRAPGKRCSASWPPSGMILRSTIGCWPR